MDIKHGVIHFIGFLILAALLWYEITRHSRESARPRIVRCRKCNYILEGINSTRCPECGAPVGSRLIARMPKVISNMVATYVVFWSGLIIYLFVVGWTLLPMGRINVSMYTLHRPQSGAYHWVLVESEHVERRPAWFVTPMSEYMIAITVRRWDNSEASIRGCLLEVTASDGIKPKKHAKTIMAKDVEVLLSSGMGGITNLDTEVAEVMLVAKSAVLGKAVSPTASYVIVAGPTTANRPATFERGFRWPWLAVTGIIWACGILFIYKAWTKGRDGVRPKNSADD